MGKMEEWTMNSKEKREMVIINIRKREERGTTTKITIRRLEYSSHPARHKNQNSNFIQLKLIVFKIIIILMNEIISKFSV